MKKIMLLASFLVFGIVTMNAQENKNGFGLGLGPSFQTQGLGGFTGSFYAGLKYIPMKFTGSIQRLRDMDNIDSTYTGYSLGMSFFLNKASYQKNYQMVGFEFGRTAGNRNFLLTYQLIIPKQGKTGILISGRLGPSFSPNPDIGIGFTGSLTVGMTLNTN